MAHTINIDVVDRTIPIGNNRNIPVINQPNPCYGYAANANEVRQLIQLSNYKITEAGTNKPITGNNYYEYFPEEQPGGGGVTPQIVQSMINASIDSTVSETSTKAVQNAAITNFVNSSIESSTAEFKGTYDSKAEMDAVTANQNDYAFLCVLNDDGSVNHYERYKWSDTEVSGSHWLFEYNVNNSSFTAEQWAAINSGVKDTDVSALGGHVNNTNNPHSVTKAQVGLSDVDNTSDADKPISTATQAALNTKFDTAGTGLNKNGTTVSHATPEGAATHVKAFYKFSTDALGHVNGVTEATEAEVDAIDSGITAAKVGQIETNKNNILTVADQSTQYNIVPIKSTITTGNASVTATVAADKSITIEITGTTSSNIGFEISDNFTIDTNTEYVMTGNPSASAIRLVLQQVASPYKWIGEQYNNQASAVTSNISFVRYYVFIYSGSSGTITIKPMLTPKSLYDAGFTEYQPYALSNVVLTAKEQQNENNIAWNTNNGVKNLLSFDADMMKSINTGGTWSGNTWSLGNNVTLTINSDKSITLNGTANAGKTIYLAKNLGMAENAYTLSTGALTTKMWAGIIEVGGTENNYTGSTTHIDKTCQPNHITLYIENGCTLSNFTVYPMLTLKPLYDADPTYQPNALSNAELTVKEQQNESNISFVASQGRKNVLNFDSVGGGSSSGITYTVNDDGTVRASGTANDLCYAYLRINNSNVDAKKYTNGQFVLSGCPSGGGSDTYSLYAARGNYVKYDYGDGVILTPTSESEVSVVIRVEKGQTVDIVFKPMIRLIGTDSTFEPHALSNVDLTEKEQANENNILLNRHYGVKNIFIPTTGSVTNPTGFTGTITLNEDNSYTINGSTGGSVYYLRLGRITMPVGTFVLYARPGDKTGISVYNDADWIDSGNDRYKTFTQPTSQNIYLRIAANQTLENYTIYPMICDLVAWNMSRDYEIGALSNAELTAKEQANENNISSLNAAKMLFTTKGYYLSQLNWTAMGTGMYYSDAESVTGISKIYAVSYTGASNLRTTDMIIPTASDNNTKVRLIANTDTFANVNATVTITIIGIA